MTPFDIIRAMRKIFVLIAVLTACTMSLHGQALTEQDREKLLTHLDTTSQAFLRSVDGLTEAQWTFRAAEGRWTIAEVTEHIAAAETLIHGAMAGIMKQPAPADMLKDARRDDVILARVPDRSRKAQAPEVLRPTNRFGSPAGAVEAFRKERLEMLKIARSGGDLRAYAGPNPVFGNTDAYGTLLFQSAHVERHTKQIEEVKADPNYPK